MLDTQYLSKRYNRNNSLPHPQEYYQTQFPVLKLGTSEWVSVKCCFHKDQSPSLRINLVQGCFRCFGCGVRGKNVLIFHSRRYQLTLKEAFLALGNGL